MSENNYRARIEALSTQINALSKERQDLIQVWAAEVSPWKVGDITYSHGYSFRGKQCQVKSVSGRLSYNGRPLVQIIATVLRQDGTLGSRTVDWMWEEKS